MRAACVAAAYRYCARLAARHYENFTVISWFVPAPLRPPLAAIYAYCRGVDDLGDEYQGDRLAALDRWEAELDRAYRGNPSHPVFVALADAISRWQLPREEFQKLIEANRRDQRQSRYATFAELLDYCRHSADPVGRLVLALFGYRDPERIAWSDAICTALQLVNFLQDVDVDRARGRCYLPEEDLAAAGIGVEAVLQGRGGPALASVVAREAERARALFDAGAPLERSVPWRLGCQLRLYRLGGLAILDRLQQIGYNPWAGRPTLSRAAKLRLAGRVLWGRGLTRPASRLG